MLDPQQPVELPALPVRAFRDHLRPQAFYLMPLTPAVARDDYGRPSVSLLAYGRQAAGRFEAQGAVLTLTTVLEIDRALEPRARAALSRWLAGNAGDGPAVEILAVEWLGGSVTARLTDRVTLSGRPSLTAPNACAFNERIAREAATGLVEAWHHGLPDGRIEYALRARTAAATSPTGEGTPFQFEGPLDIGRDALGRALSTANL